MLKSRVEDIHFYPKKTLKVGEKLIDMSIPKIMGIINCTPDSFYRASQHMSVSSVLKQVEQHIIDGADMIDFGANSSRPGAEITSENEEINRLLPILEEVKINFPDLIISVDTFRAKVAEKSLELGVNIINDISAFEFDEKLIGVLKKFKCPYVLMHSKGNSMTMQNLSQYSNLFKEICQFFSQKIEILQQNGIYDVIIDPGFGFAKTIEQNYQLLNHLEDFKFLEKIMLIGVSRKSMIYKKLNLSAEESLNGTTVLNTIALQKGAQILRVHDVKEAKQIVNLIC